MKPKKEDLSGSPRRRKNTTKDNSQVRLDEGCLARTAKPLIFSPSLAHFPFAYKYMYFKLNEGSVFRRENTLLRVSFLSYS